MGSSARSERASGGKRWVAVTLAGVLVLTGGFVAFQWGESGRADADCTTLERESVEDAATVAVLCDEEVEVLAERTPWASTFARPDGASRLEMSTVPSRTDANGDWEPVSIDVSAVPEAGASRGSSSGGVGNGDGVSGARFSEVGAPLPPGVVGMLPVQAPVYPMWFNPGGSAGEGLPVGVIQRDTSWMKLWFPLPLSEPVIYGRFVTYHLGPGVRLVIAVVTDGAGFRPIVELDSPVAATWFQDALESVRASEDLPGTGFEIPYRVEASPGLSLRGIEGVGFEFVDADEEVVFWSPPSVMWDSSADAPAADRVEFPADGDRAVIMPVRVDEAPDADVIVVSPDEGMLSSAETAWPVRIDPTTGARTPAEWVQLRTGGFTAPKYKWTDTTARNGEGMGRCLTSWQSSCNANFTARLVWEFGGLSTWTVPLVGGDIVSATFSADPTNRGNCTSSRTDAHATGDIVSTNPSWSSISFNTLQSHITAPQGDNCSDGGVRRSWDVKPTVINAVNGDWANVSIGLKANNETNSNGYKTYRADARLEIVYNRAPYLPTQLKLASPNVPCVTGANRPMIATTTPTISAVFSDPDGGSVWGQFQVTAAGSETELWNSGSVAAKASGSTFSASVAAGKLVHGQSYRYRATASDGSRWSGWSSAVCEFTVDTEKPVTPTVTPVRTAVAAIYDPNVERGAVGREGRFSLDRGASADVVSFHYSFNNTSLTQTVAVGSTGVVTIPYTPTAAGAVTLRVATKDAAGNQSPTRTYAFTVASPKEDAVWMFDEGSGTAAADTSGVGASKSMTLSGPVWAAGPHELFASRPGDKALRFDGVNDLASAAPIVDTTKSFVVSAYVWIDAAKLGSGSYTAVSQDGVAQSGFEVSYQPSCAGMTGGCWAFGMKNADQNAAAAATVTSPAPVTGDSWVHLVGAHDAGTKKVKLWVCEIGTPANPGAGEPVYAEASRTATPWKATGAFVAGRGWENGASSRWWPGRVDNIRVFSGQVVSEPKIRRLCQGAEAHDFSSGLDALDPTTTNGE